MRPDLEAEFEDFVAAASPRLFRAAYAITRDHHLAEDAVQSALGKAYARWSRVTRSEHPEAYVRRMVVNERTSWWRRFQRRETPTDTVPDAAVADREPDDHDRIWAACRRLPEAQRTAVALRYYEQLEYPEIAELTGVREGTVRSRVSRGLAVLREELTDDD